MKERIAVLCGARSPFTKSGTLLKEVEADDLGALLVRHLLLQAPVRPDEIDEVIIGNVSQPSHAANIARVVALKAGLPDAVPAMSVQRNCASGMEAISTAMTKLWANKGKVLLAGGTESMSNIPFLFSKKMKSCFEKLQASRTLYEKLGVLSSVRLSFLKPSIGLVDGLTDPVCGQLMGVTAENLVKEFAISREEQDEFALLSHQKASLARESGFFSAEILPLVTPTATHQYVDSDNGPRSDQTYEKLAKLKPYFDRAYGSVTVGNACPITDGAAAMVLMKESEAKERGYPIAGYVVDYAYSGLEPERMGLGPVYATSKLLHACQRKVADIDLFEINEAFSAQVLANVRAFDSTAFAQQYLGRTAALGAIDPDRLNCNGGAIALGHPVGATGVRLILTLLKGLQQKGLQTGIASLCIGGGQGAAFLLEAA